MRPVLVGRAIPVVRRDRLEGFSGLRVVPRGEWGHIVHPVTTLSLSLHPHPHRRRRLGPPSSALTVRERLSPRSLPPGQLPVNSRRYENFLMSEGERMWYWRNRMENERWFWVVLVWDRLLFRECVFLND